MTFYTTSSISLDDIRDIRKVNEKVLRTLVIYEEMDMDITAEVYPRSLGHLHGPIEDSYPSESPEISSIMLYIHDNDTSENIPVSWDDLLKKKQEEIEKELFAQANEPPDSPDYD